MQMVKTARRAAKEAGAANIDVRVGDIRRPPLRPDSVDVVLSNCVLGMFPDKEQVLSVIAGALRPGGMAVISDVVYADGTPPEGMTTAESASAEEFAQCVVGVTASQYRQLVLNAGFADAEIVSEGPVAYRDGTQVASATVFAYRGERAPSESCC
jgi:arsenite methyltransferase